MYVACDTSDVELITGSLSGLKNETTLAGTFVDGPGVELSIEWVVVVNEGSVLTCGGVETKV